MKKLLLLFSIVTIASCTQSLEPSIENINSIFQSKDFTSEYIRDSHDKESMSFRDDYIVYKKAEGVKRRTITYKEALFINDFIKTNSSLINTTIQKLLLSLF
ncbi:hypothetical protein [Nonlabens sp.]|uniref:hypothetical protein n=1 Tax=Nonlabens sp. TaxID=1888209 RepID=UPI0025E2A43A|nr:hypothetical protein [Nonlabens sp.]